MGEFLGPYRLIVPLMLLLTASVAFAASPTITIKNNHKYPYNGPVTFKASVPDGVYKDKAGVLEVSGGVARAVVNLPASTGVSFKKISPAAADLKKGDLTANFGDGLDLNWKDKKAAYVDFGLVVISGTSADADDAIKAFKPIDLSNGKWVGGSFVNTSKTGDYNVELTLTPYGGGWVDVAAKITRVSGDNGSAYVAFVRKIETAAVNNAAMRLNGRVISAASEPATTHKDFRYGQGIDWYSWKSSGLSFAAVNRFTPGLSAQNDKGQWIPVNNFYVLQHEINQGNNIYLVSEISGPDPLGKNVSRAAEKTYVQPLKDEPVNLSSRVLVSENPSRDWAEAHFLVAAGHRKVTTSNDSVVVDLGAPFVQFGTSYFPYSTMTENHDFYRTAGLNQETWWPYSAKMWENWRAYVPQMQTDFRIIKAMGFEWVRMHHLEMLATMDRKNAMAFIDWYMNEAKSLGLKVLVDTAGSTDWFTTLASKYKDVALRFEIENEILIPGVKPGDAERWTACYKAVKAANPNAEAFLTGNCNHGITQRIERLGVPFDRVGFHSYVHGTGWEEALSSSAMGNAGVATDYGTTTILGEFNWKEITRLSPEAKAEKYALAYGKYLEPRAVPEVFQFHFQETMSVNPRTCRLGIRHYETINLDRRPKPEAVEFMKLIKRYSRPDAPVRVLPISITETALKGGKAQAVFTIKNDTTKPVSLMLSAQSFGDVTAKLLSASNVSIKPGQSATGKIALAAKPGAKKGTYHYFLKANYSGKTAWGWGITANQGAPTFDEKLVLPELVNYPQGPAIVNKFDYSKPICVAFGADSPIDELEMAFVVFNTLQSATGRPVRLCSTADIPESMLKSANLILVGSPEGNPMVKDAGLTLTKGKGTVLLQDKGNGIQWLYLAGSNEMDTEAAATDFVLRYWKNAKDSTSRISGLEKGAALGNETTKGEIYLP